MKGLLIKEFLGLRRYFKTFIILFFLCIGLCIFNKSIATLAAIGGFLSMTCTMTTFSYDHYNHWDAFSLTLPLSRRDLVKSKYLFMFILSFIAAFITLIADLIIGIFLHLPFYEILSAFIGSFVSSLMLAALIIPLVYTFGVEKARFVLIALIFTTVFLITGIGFFVQTMGLPMFSETALLLLIYLAPFLTLACAALSYFISVRVFLKTEM